MVPVKEVLLYPERKHGVQGPLSQLGLTAHGYWGHIL